MTALTLLTVGAIFGAALCICIVWIMEGIEASGLDGDRDGWE